MMLRVIGCLLCVCLIGCKTSNAAAPFRFDRDVGVLLQRDGQTCLELRDTTFANQIIQFVASSDPQTVGAVHVDVLSPDCGALFTDLPRFYYYRGTIVRGSIQVGAPALAVANVSKRLPVVYGIMALDLDGDGIRELFSACRSSEGVHLSLWAGAPPGGRREWHRYVYLNADFDATCSDAESKPDSL